MKKVIVIVIFIMVLTTIKIPAHAGGLSPAKVTLSDSRAGQSGVSYTFAFTTTTTGIISTIDLQYCKTAIERCEIPNGIITTSAFQGTLSGLGTSSSTFTTNGAIKLTVEHPSLVLSSTNIAIPYKNMTNPTSINSSFFVRITTKNAKDEIIDTSSVAFATLTSTSMAVSAYVEAGFSFGITPVTSGMVNGTPINLTTTTANSIPFGSLTSGVRIIAAHDISVGTNSTYGYLITVKSDNPPLTNNLNNIDTFEGSNSKPILWFTPDGQNPNENTGFFGYTTESVTLCSGVPNRFSSNKWAGFETNEVEIACFPKAANEKGTIRIGWQVEVNNIQPAGAYSGNIIIVTTPTY